MYKPLHKFKVSVDGILGLDMPLISHNLPAEFARLRAFLVG
ncbi:hypothetical protein [Aeromonas dhakensis]|nr:hypothetical protein [Aeromonas dhakensis]MDX7831349.1 hypothetical protein [Aeromonas dhakensis]